MTADRRRSVGTALVWLGVLAWAPFLFLIAAKQPVSIVPFLAAHLSGVLGGGWLRSSADKLDGGAPGQSHHGRRRKAISTVLIYLGVLAWAPYFYLSRVLGQDVDIAPFLAAHLTGVLGGGALLASLVVSQLTKRP